jgi:hypothetical protein
VVKWFAKRGEGASKPLPPLSIELTDREQTHPVIINLASRRRSQDQKCEISREVIGHEWLC